MARPLAIDSNAAAGHALKAETHSAAVFQDLQQCLASVQIDVVHICTPSTSHSSLSRISLEHGAHVLVEKPGAGSIREAEELVKLAAARGLKINPVHQFPFQNGFMATALAFFTHRGRPTRNYLSYTGTVDICGAAVSARSPADVTPADVGRSSALPCISLMLGLLYHGHRFEIVRSDS